MASFWDLPRPVRDTIYRLHLVKNEPIAEDEHFKLVTTRQYTRRRYGALKRVPPICALSTKADKEAAPIYYGENHFAFGPGKHGGESRIGPFATQSWTRHLRMVRKVTIQWPKPGTYGAWGGVAREAFLEIGRMTSLKELYIRVDEKEMVREMLWSRRTRRQRRAGSDAPITPQENLAILRHPGMTGLLTLHGILQVQFIKRLGYGGNEYGGPIPGGLLETEIAARLRGPKRSNLRQKSGNGAFPFFQLPPELRNRIYAMLLCVPGDLEPSPREPSSAPKKCSSNGHLPPPGSALNILAVNHQILDEAVGIFYHANEFRFATPPRMAAFVVTLSDVRAGSIRDLTLHYERTRSDETELAAISLPMLKRLTGLRKLHVLSQADVLGGLFQMYQRSTMVYIYDFCNPVKLPGIRTLFSLRGITDIKFCDLLLDQNLERLKKDKRYPDGFPVESRDEAIVSLERIMKHFNAALADAQTGKVNTKMLMDDEWQTRDEFPVIELEPQISPGEGDTEAKMDGLDGGDDTVEDGAEANADNETDALAAGVDQTRSILVEKGEPNEPVLEAPGPVTRAMKRASQAAQAAEIGPEETDNHLPAMEDANGLRGGGEQEVEGDVGGGDYTATIEEDIEDEIVVKHVARPGKPLPETAEDGDPSARTKVKVDLDDESGIEDSYAMREMSVEL